MKVFREVAIPVLIAVAVFALLRLNVQTYAVGMSSMEPNFHGVESIVVSKASYFFSDPARGDVIVLDPPLESEIPFIKRVIGLPNETVEIRNGQVFIDETAIDEPYILPEPPQRYEDYGPLKLSDDEYLVIGDNRNVSSDSRSWGPIKRNDIIGKAWFIYWPPSRWGVVKHYTYPELSGVNQQEMVTNQSYGVQLE